LVIALMLTTGTFVAINAAEEAIGEESEGGGEGCGAMKDFTREAGGDWYMAHSGMSSGSHAGWTYELGPSGLFPYPGETGLFQNWVAFTTRHWPPCEE
jgi:hypothetical protein